MEVITKANISKSDTKLLFDGGKMQADEKGNVKWLDADYQGKFSYLKAQANNKTLLWYRDNLLMWIFPIELIKEFSEVYVLTFLFEGSHMKHFLDLYTIPYEFYQIADNYELLEGEQDLTARKRQLASLLTIYEGTLNAIGDAVFSLSSTWYEKAIKSGKARIVAKNAENYLRHKQKAKADDTMYTTLVEVKQKAPIKNYGSAFVSCNLRATNMFRNKSNLCYLLNVFENPFVMGYFKDYGIELNQDAIALSQLLQWVWRSRIREGKPVNIYIPSKRMRTLLQTWLAA
jgi:hypothetical protein